MDFTEQLITASEDERFDLLAKAYAQNADASGDDALTRIIHSDNTLAKLLLCRFLTHAPEPKATAFLREIMLTGSALAVNAAIKAYTRNSYGQKGRELMPVLKSPTQSARLFAMETLAHDGVTQALQPILATLSATDDREERLRILSALRWLPDAVLLEALKDYLRHPDAEARALSALAYGSLYMRGDKRAERLLVGSAGDEHPRVRAVVLWQLRQKKHRRHVSLFLDCLAHDENPATRSEALAGLVPWPVKPVVRAILGVAARDPVRVVALKAQGALFSMHGSRLNRTLARLCRDKDAMIRAKAMETLAGFRQDSPGFRNFLQRKLARADNPRERLFVFNAFAVLRQGSAIPTLEKYLSGDAMTAYAAMSAILKCLGGRHAGRAARYLDDPLLSDIPRQMVLKHLANSGFVADSRLAILLGEFLDSPSMNVRYLSAQILAHSPRAESLMPLARLYARETDPEVARVLERLIGEIIRAKPSLFALPVQAFPESANVISLVLRALSDADVGATEARAVTGTMLALFRGRVLEMFTGELGKILLDFLGRGVLSPDEFALAVKLGDDPALVLKAVARAFTLSPNSGSSGMVGEFIATLKTLVPDDPALWLKLIPLLGERPAIRELTAVLCDDSRLALHDEARGLLSRYWGEGSA